MFGFHIMEYQKNDVSNVVVNMREKMAEMRQGELEHVMFRVNQYTKQRKIQEDDPKSYE